MPDAQPTIIRDPELAAVLAELQRTRDILLRIEDFLTVKRTPWTGLAEGKVEKGGLNVGPSQVVNRPQPPAPSNKPIPVPKDWPPKDWHNYRGGGDTREPGFRRWWEFW